MTIESKIPTKILNIINTIDEEGKRHDAHKGRRAHLVKNQFRNDVLCFEKAEGINDRLCYHLFRSSSHRS